MTKSDRLLLNLATLGQDIAPAFGVGQRILGQHIRNIRRTDGPGRSGSHHIGHHPMRRPGDQHPLQRRGELPFAVLGGAHTLRDQV